MNSRVLLVVAWIGLCSVVGSLAQPSTAAVENANHSSGFGQDPEDAYLSSTRYINAYFGFEISFPENMGLKPVPQPASTDNRTLLLELTGVAPGHAGISIAAYEYKNKNYTDAKSLLRRQLDQELFYGVQELHGISKTSVGGRQFYYYETRRGVDQHVVVAAETNAHVLDIDLRARDPKVVHDLFASIQGAEFFPAEEAKQRAGTDARPYQGPAISAEHLREVRDSPPAEKIDPGSVEGNVYRNRQIGMTYHFPAGWHIAPVGAVEPAVEHYREKVAGEPLLGVRERQVVKACRKTLLSVWRTKPQSDGEVPYDDFGEVTLSTMPLSCFPNIRFPSNVNDATEVRQFIVGLSFTQPLQRDMNVARTYKVGGKTFVVTQGTIAYKQEGEALSRRVSVALAMTEQRGFLLIWLLAAPHEGELRELMQAKVGFDRESEVAEAAPNTPGGGVSTEGDTEKSSMMLSGEDASASKDAAVSVEPSTTTTIQQSKENGQIQTKQPADPKSVPNFPFP